MTPPAGGTGGTGWPPNAVLPEDVHQQEPLPLKPASQDVQVGTGGHMTERPLSFLG